MAGRRTGGGVPNGTIRRVSRRSTIWGALDARRTAEQDIQYDRFVRPRGLGGAIVTGPSGGQERYVSNPMGRTFRPGSTVPLGSSSGEGGEFVIAGPPGGRRGSRPASRAVRPYATFVPSASNQYAFGSDGLGSMLALLYSDGTYVSTRATETEVSGDFVGCILSDSSEIVGDGSALMFDSSGSTLRVWDVVGEAVYSYTVPSGWTNPTHPYYQNGYLYWCEFEDITPADVGSGEATFDYRLRRSATDLSSVTTVLTVTSANANSYGLPFTAYQEPAKPIAFAVDEDGAVLYLEVIVTEITNHEITEWEGLQVRFDLAGSAANRAFTTPEMAVNGSGYIGMQHHSVTVGGASFAIAAKDTGVASIVAKADNASAGPTDLWGATDLDGRYVSALSIGTGGLVLQVHDAPNGLILRGAASPPAVVASTIDPFDGTNFPLAMFYFGA